MLTILTATYNRGHLLRACYRSLLGETCTDFEWLIIDDGSTDDTEKVVSAIRNENPPFAVRYVKKENGGKHTALNFSHPYINGQYVMMLDDDDTLSPDAVETVLRAWKEYDGNGRIGCISYQRGSAETGKPLIPWRGKESVVSNYIDFRVNGHRRGDAAEVVRRKMLLEYPAPVFDGEKFLPEDFLWVNSAYEYDTLYINRVIYLSEYRADGLTKGKERNRFSFPKGGMYTCSLYLNSRVAFSVRVKKAVLYDLYAISTGECTKYLKCSKSPVLTGLMLPAAWLLYMTLFRHHRIKGE